MTTARGLAERDAGDAGASRVVADEVERLSGQSYDELVALVGKREQRTAQTDAGTSLDVRTRAIWDDDRKRNVRVIVEVWASGSPGQPGADEVGDDDFVLSPDGRGGVVGPVRRMESVERSPADIRGRSLRYGLLLCIGWPIWAWANDGKEFAIASSIAWFIVAVLLVWRWRHPRDY